MTVAKGHIALHSDSVSWRWSTLRTWASTFLLFRRHVASSTGHCTALLHSTIWAPDQIVRLRCHSISDETVQVV